MGIRSIYALHCAGPFEALSAFLDWREDGSGTALENYYTWYVSGEDSMGGGILVDTGPRASLLGQKKAATSFHAPEQLLPGIGVEPDSIGHLVLSHLHWDHCGGVERFPAARVYVQRAEYEFWINDPIARRSTFRAMADGDSERLLAEMAADGNPGRLELPAGDLEIAPGVRLLSASGHTPGLQAVAVDTEAGTAIIASDAAHLFSNLASDTPSAFTYDRVECVRSYDRLREIADGDDLIFPGHDPLLATAYPRVANRVTRLA